MPSVEQLNLFHARFFRSSFGSLHNASNINVILPKLSGTYWVLAVHRKSSAFGDSIVPMRMYCAERHTGHKTWHEIDDNGNIRHEDTEYIVLMWIEPNHDKAEKRRNTSHGGNHVA